ncbi:MAG: hypothetical protein KJ000_20370 [Pirellulaceae bacterium]|nr:hypothetical protein [Pirellulaceae bacterium]
MIENQELAAKQNAFLAALTPDERAVFDAARRAGSSFGESQLALENHRRRSAKAAAKAAAKRSTQSVL